MIIFVHLHKCGGTTINHILKENKKKHPKSRNGNPWDKNGIIPYWNFNKLEFSNFINNCYKKGTEYICLEWNYFINYTTLDLSKLKQIIIFRDPYSRYISILKHDEYEHQNYDYDSFKNVDIVWERPQLTNQKFNINNNKDNYYVLLLNGLGNKHNIKVKKKHLTIAKERLNTFDTIIILENKDSFNLLKKYGINDINNTKSNVSKILNEYNVDKMEFEKNNTFDRKLYNYAIKLSNNQLTNNTNYQ